MADKTALQAAALAWNNPNESMESIELRIHDGFPLSELERRGDIYVHGMFAKFPYLQPHNDWQIMEVGSGVGYIMQALARNLEKRKLTGYKIIGLDIAEHMLAKARERIGGDPHYDFLHYDGLTVPRPDASLDFIYSIAAIQHIPKIYVYNLFFEFKRLLKPNGFAAIHYLPFTDLKKQSEHIPWRDEVTRQINNVPSHWHHFYSVEELECVLRDGTGFAHVEARPDGMVCFGPTKPRR